MRNIRTSGDVIEEFHSGIAAPLFDDNGVDSIVDFPPDDALVESRAMPMLTALTLYRGIGITGDFLRADGIVERFAQRSSDMTLDVRVAAGYARRGADKGAGVLIVLRTQVGQKLALNDDIELCGLIMPPTQGIIIEGADGGDNVAIDGIPVSREYDIQHVVYCRTG